MVKGNLKTICDSRVNRIKQNLFNVFIMFGDTRSGKSTLGRIVGKYMSEQLNVPFDVLANISFTVEQHHIKSSNPQAQKQIFILDEASYDLLAQDRGNQWQLKLIQFFNTAAKYNQTHILILPNIGQIKKDFLISGHVCGFRTHINQKKTEEGILYEIGKGEFLNAIDLLGIYDQYVKRQYAAYLFSRGEGKHITITKEDDLCEEDLEIYERMKDAAIMSHAESIKKER